MRKYIYVFSLLISTIIVNGQEKRLTLGFGLGSALAQSDFKDWSKGRNCFYVNAMYNFTERFSTGIEGNFSRFYPRDRGNFEDQTKVDGVLLKGLYYSKFKIVRTYWAVMAGFYNNTFSYPSGYDGDEWAESIYSSNLGGGIMLGITYKKLNFDIAYYNLSNLKRKLDHWGSYVNLNENISFIQIRVGLNISFFTKKKD